MKTRSQGVRRRPDNKRPHVACQGELYFILFINLLRAEEVFGTD